VEFAIDLFFNCCFVVCLKSLALFPAKFHEGMWIRRGNFSCTNEACKVTCIVCKVLFFEQGRLLNVAKPTPADESSQIPIALGDGEIGSSDDGMPPPSVWGAM
ncbi:hypothetical protein HID58_050417, partial [Brassica napus]